MERLLGSVYASLCVLCLVAWHAERDPVVEAHPQLGMLGERMNVVRVEVAATIIATPPAREAVAGEYVVAPALVFGGEAFTSSLYRPSVPVGVVSCASHCLARRPVRCADLGAGFWRSRLALVRAGAGIRLASGSYLGASLVRMRLAFEGRGSPPDIHADRDPATTSALCVEPIAARPVTPEAVACSPLFALSASLLRGEPSLEVVDRHSCHLGGCLEGSFSCLGHARMVGYFYG